MIRSDRSTKLLARFVSILFGVAGCRNAIKNPYTRLLCLDKIALDTVIIWPYIARLSSSDEYVVSTETFELILLVNALHTAFNFYGRNNGLLAISLILGVLICWVLAS